MNQLSIKMKILGVTIASLFITFLILGFYNAKNNYSAQYNLIKQKELNLSKSTSKFINSYLQAKIDILKAAADEISKEELLITNSQIVNKLRLASKAGGFVSLYLGFDANGNYLNSKGKSRTPQTTKYDSRQRPWYKLAAQMKKAGVTDPYLDYSTKKLVVSVFAPIYNNNKLVAVVSSDIFIDTIVDSVLNVNLDGHGTAYLINNKENIIIHKNTKLLKSKDNLYSQIKDSNFGEVVQDGKTKLLAFSNIETTGWKLLVTLDKDTILKKINSQIFTEIVLYIILLILISVLIFFTLIKILSPLGKVQQGLNYFFKYLKGEEKNIAKLNISTNDEFGQMASIIDTQMQTISDKLEKDKLLIENVKEVVAEVNTGKLDLTVEKSTTNESLNELKNILNEMIKTISNNVNCDINPILEQFKNFSELNFQKEITNANGDIAKGLNELSNIINEMLKETKENGLALQDSSDTLLNNVESLNKSSTQTASSLKLTSNSIEEITNTVVKNTQKVSLMTQHSNELSNSIKKGQDLASSTVVSMDEINEQTQAIAEAITIIDQIAFQTNILSLNAAVEAATAGEAGKGFAVVAQEVRNLASRSAEAAKEIKDLVENATSKTDNGKKIADEMINGYKTLNENIQKTTTTIEEISEASYEQKNSIEQINSVISSLEEQTQNNASIASKTQDIAKSTSVLAQEMLKAVNEKKFRE